MPGCQRRHFRLNAPVQGLAWNVACCLWLLRPHCLSRVDTKPPRHETMVWYVHHLTESMKIPRWKQAVPRWKRVTRRATTQGPIIKERGLTQNLPGWQPKENSFPTAKAGPSAQSTPLLRVAQKPWGGHPRCGRPADYLPPGTVGQWPPAPCNGGPSARAATR